MLKAYQMIRLIGGAHNGGNAQVVPPLPRNEKDGYNIQVSWSNRTFKVFPGQYVPLRARRR
jgi:hypothetical protein